MSTKLLQRLASRRGGDQSHPHGREGFHNYHEAITVESECTDTRQDSYAHSYYSAIKEMGLPIMNPNYNARQKFVKKSDTKSSLTTQLDNTKQPNKTEVDSETERSRPKHAEETAASVMPVSHTRSFRRSHSRDRRSQNSSASRSKASTRSYTAPSARRSPVRHCAPRDMRSRSPPQRRLTSPTASSSKRYHTPECARKDRSPDRLSGSDEWTRVVSWLDDFKFRKYMGLFRRCGISSLRQMQTVTVADLADIGIALNDIPVLKQRISELLQQSKKSSSRRYNDSIDSSSSSSDDQEGLEAFWENVSSKVSSNRGESDDGRRQSASPGNRPRYGSPSGTSSTVAAARMGITQNFFDKHGNVARVPENAKTLFSRQPEVSFADSVSLERSRGRKLSAKMTPSRERLSSQTSSIRKRVLLSEDLRPKQTEIADKRQDGNEWQQVCEWLASINLSNYEGLFLRSGITKIKSVKSLTYHDLAQMGLRNTRDYPVIISTAKRMALPKSNDSHTDPPIKASHHSSNATGAFQKEVSFLTRTPLDNCHIDRSTTSLDSGVKRSGPTADHIDSFWAKSLNARLFRSEDARQPVETLYIYDSSSSSISGSNIGNSSDVGGGESQHTSRLPIEDLAQYSCVRKLLQAFWNGDDQLFYRVWAAVMGELDSRYDVPKAMMRAADIMELLTRVYFVTLSQRSQWDGKANGARKSFRSYVDFVLANPVRYDALLKSREFVKFVGLGMLPDARGNETYASLFHVGWANGVSQRLETFVNHVVATSAGSSSLRHFAWGAELRGVAQVGSKDIAEESHPLKTDSFEDNPYIAEETQESSNHTGDDSVYKLHGRLYTIDEPMVHQSDGAIYHHSELLLGGPAVSPMVEAPFCNLQESADMNSSLASNKVDALTAESCTPQVQVVQSLRHVDTISAENNAIDEHAVNDVIGEKEDSMIDTTIGDDTVDINKFPIEAAIADIIALDAPALGIPNAAENENTVYKINSVFDDVNQRNSVFAKTSEEVFHFNIVQCQKKTFYVDLTVLISLGE